MEDSLQVKKMIKGLLKMYVDDLVMYLVSYEARAAGVKRSMRGSDAVKACPELVLVQVPVAYGKADIGIYRDAGDRVVRILSKRYK